MPLFRASTFGACLLPLFLVACDSQPNNHDPRTQPPLVRVASAERAPSSHRSFTGVVVARVQSDLGFRVSGKVIERLVDTGQAVKRGQLLLRLDPLDLELQAKAREQAVAAAKARALQAADDELRNRDLVAAGAISAAAYDRIKSLAQTSGAEWLAAQSQAAVARNETGYAILTADSDGVVVQTLAEPGQVVSAGQPVVRLARAGRREAIVQLPETMRPALGSSAQATLFGGSGPAVSAQLRQLSDAADPLTRTFEARYVLEGEHANAPLGSTVTLDIAPNLPAANSLSVPLAAIYDPGKGPGVWVISGTPSKVSWRAVHITRVGDDSATIQGLQLGEQVVALGPHLLQEGQEVLVAPKDSPTLAEGRP
ncbi:efflux RND transporter periplasmic adaptor subunit [Pseudomonas sp. nanlin1]|uniref:efflux RND transporter periplasmic adaptor subunit n=1 Tax=Pseudomonas sp. nanlin1 TaxID=3040605 RepID=UPI00389117E3